MTPHRLDWRLLLPHPPAGRFEHLVLLGGAAGLAERVIELGVARRVSRELPSGRSADAVVALGDGPRSAVETTRCLIPGGALYWEVNRRIPALAGATPAWTQRELRHAGLTPTGAYLIRSLPSQGRIYVPLNAPRALTWYLRTLKTPASPGQWIRDAALSVAGSSAPGTVSRLVRFYAVTAVCGPTVDRGTLILGHPESPGRLDRSASHPLLLSMGSNDYRRQVVFAFAASASTPAAVLKIPRIPAGNASVEREHTVLAAVRNHVRPPLRDSLPEPLGLVRAAGLSVSFESYAAGRPVAVSTGRWGTSGRRQVADLQRAAEWLTAFHAQATLERVCWDRAAVSKWVERPLEGFAAAFEITPEERRLFAVLHERACRLAGAAIPILWQHGSFDPPNVIRRGRRINVIDWEHAEPGLPLQDLIHFVIRWSFAAGALRSPEAQVARIAQLFCATTRDDPLGAAVHRVLARYMSDLGLDGRLLPISVVLTCAADALRAYDRSAVRHEGERSRRDVKSYVAVLLSSLAMLATQCDRLFPPEEP